MTVELPVPEPGRQRAENYVVSHLAHLISDRVAGSDSLAGGQRSADAALQSFDVTGYANRRNEVYPDHRRGASRLSPFIRHGLLHLGEVWDHVAGGPHRDVQKFRDELLWQEFARHWYARLGKATKHGVRYTLAATTPNGGWDRRLACVEAAVGELESAGWLVNQARMWLASHWTLRDGLDWRLGEDEFFRHLLDGSRAANRLGWQWTTGVGSSKHYGFSRSQVEQRAPGICATCELKANCPIQDWPAKPSLDLREPPVAIRGDANLAATAGPQQPLRTGTPSVVWLTAESLGDRDPALAANPDLPVIFVFDEPLLEHLQLSSKRIVFLVETLAEIAEHRELSLLLGSPIDALADRSVAVTFAPVPGFRSRSAAVRPVEVHPWPWLTKPHSKSIASFSAWRKSISRTT